MTGFTTVTGLQILKKKKPKPILIYKYNAEIIQLAKTNCWKVEFKPAMLI